MEVIRKKTTLNNLSFNVLLTQDIKNLGIAEDLSTDMTVEEVTNTVEGVGTNKLTSVRSFDYSNPYKVGVNGVLAIEADSIKYVIEGVIHNTENDTLNTTIEITKTEKIFTHHNFIRPENTLGLSDKVDLDNEVDIERPVLSVIENFSKLQQINNPDELNGFSNNFYKVYDETL